MQTPNSKTPIPRCLALAHYAAWMLGKFASNSDLVALSQQMTAAADALEAASTAYEDSKRAIIRARVDVKYADFLSDSEVQNLLRRAELADGKSGGPIYRVLAPDGKTPLIKPFGQSQVDVLEDLKGRIEAATPLWADAPKELGTVQKIQTDYSTAITTRTTAWNTAKKLRVARNVAKDQFVTAYVHITLEVKQLFPRDPRMQDLFFDEVEKDQNEPEAEAGAAGESGATEAAGAGAASGAKEPAGNT